MTYPEFPCIEPLKCFLSSQAHNRRLSSNAKGELRMIKNGWGHATWDVVKDGYDDVGNIIVKLRSQDHKTYLASTANGDVFTTSDEDSGNVCEKWHMINLQETGGAYALISTEYSRQLECNDDHKLSTVTYKDDTLHKHSHWKVEFQTGELFYLSPYGGSKCMTCDQIGDLTMSNSKEGYQVWRFIDIGDGNVYITSWAHDNKKVLCSNYEGDLYTTDNLLNEWTKWKVEKAPNNGDGKIIQSVAHKKLLCLDSEGLCVTKDSETGKSIWDIKPAHSQIYYLSNSGYNKRIGISMDKEGLLFLAPIRSEQYRWKTKDEREMWEIADGGDDSIRLYSNALDRYLISNADGEVSTGILRDSEDGNWQVQPSPNGGYFFVSKEQGMYLACDGHILYTSKESGTSETWKLEPVLPFKPSSDPNDGVNSHKPPFCKWRAWNSDSPNRHCDMLSQAYVSYRDNLV